MELWDYERQAWNSGAETVCGVDEAGAGPLMGPVYAAAVILPRESKVLQKNVPLNGIRDEVYIFLAFCAVSRVEVLRGVLAGKHRDIRRKQRVHSFHETFAGYPAVNVDVEAELPRMHSGIRPGAAVDHRRGYLEQLSYAVLDCLLDGQGVVLPLESVVSSAVVVYENL